ncbi:formin-like protein 14, partial [Nilaparvata lugens]|uniref:formin-like protein 14 n=1 Tax=Nilaparvata lugens TaxID=108931 RepID=UPI00193C9E4F
LLQPPDPKAVKSRGSWPGPGVARLLGSCPAEMSRSDQHLSGTPPPPPPHPPHPSPSPHPHPPSPPPPPLPPPRPTPTRPPPPANDHIETIRLPPSRSEDTLHMHTRITPRTRATVSATTSPLLPSRPTGYGSGNSLQSSSEESALANQTSKSEGEAEEEGATVPAPAPGILQVYAAYETGLAAGTSLKLHVSPRTSAREVVDLVVKQLNMAVVLKGKDGPIYAADQLSNFCLVAVIGARERCLRDDFKPLQLQNPWKKGRLYVRQKHDVLAALEHSSRHSAFL